MQDKTKGRHGKGPLVRGAIGLMVAMTALLLFVQPALAVKSRPFLFSFTVPAGVDRQQKPNDVAIDATNHAVYVSSRGNDQALKGRIYRFDSSGKLDPLHPELTGFTWGDAYAVAVDNSSGGTDGTVYGSGTVGLGPAAVGHIQQYTSAGTATSVNISPADVPPDGTPQGGGLPPIVNNGEAAWRDLAVHEGNLYALDMANGVVDVFTSSGTFVAQLGFGNIPANPTVLGIEPDGRMVVGSTIGRKVVALDSEGKCINMCAPISTREVNGVAVTGAGDLVMSVLEKDHPYLEELTSDGALVTSFGAEVFEGDEGPVPQGLAVDSLDQVFVSNPRKSEFVGDVKVFGPIFIRPDATTEPATNVTDHSAVFHGIVGADGGPDATCKFQYVDDATFQSSGFGEAESAECNPSGPFSGTGTDAVEADGANISGGTAYHYRLVATSVNGSTTGKDLPFTTHGPTVGQQSARSVTETSVTLNGSVNPRGSETSYRFQYVSQAQFEANGYTEAAEVPLGGEGIGGGTGPVSVSQEIDGLTTATTYRFRILATSADGTTAGPDSSVTTYAVPGSGLPDGRAYEQATPVEKNGSSAQGETNAVQAAAEGGGVTFFASAGLPGGEGAQTFPSYLATRNQSGSGWSTQGLLPPAATGPYANVLGWSEDLQQSYASSKPIGSPAVLYQRNSADRFLRPISPGEGGQRFPYAFAAASAGGHEVFFENTLGGVLAPGAVPGKSNAYIWDESTDTVTLAGVLNDGQAPPEGSFAGPYDWFHGKKLSTGGASDQYLTQATHTISRDGKRLFFTAAGSGRLYMRENPTAAQSPLDGEGECTDPALACTIEISAPAEGLLDPSLPAAFIGATSDGSIAFFLSAGKLTQDASAGGYQLYRYEAESGQLTNVSAVPGEQIDANVQGVLGYSDDGSYVYFAANGVLAPGASPGNCVVGKGIGSCNVYVAHGSSIAFVTRLSSGIVPGHADVANWSPTASRAGGGQEVTTGRVAADGLTLLFRSARQLGGYDNEGKFELYRYHIGDGSPICVSCNPTGVAPTGDAAFQAFPERFTGPKLGFAVRTRNLSADGSRVFFDSPDKLVASDTNGVNNVYEWEARGSGSCVSEIQNGGCLYLISGGRSPEPSFFGDADVSGDNVFFFTDQSLVGQDQDELVDVYDARVGGGIAAQSPPPPPPPCEGEGCRSAPPPGGGQAPSPGSSSFVGPPNPKPRHHKPHKKRHHKKHKHGKHGKKGGRR